MARFWGQLKVAIADQCVINMNAAAVLLFDPCDDPQCGGISAA
jgi:hypothetical protein